MKFRYKICKYILKIIAYYHNLFQDINNHPPLFSQNGFYEETIPEDTAPGEKKKIKSNFESIIIA